MLLGLGGCAAQSTSDRAGAPPSAPSHETQLITFALIKSTVLCLAKNRPVHPGQVVLGGAFSDPGEPVEVFDSDSTPGNEAAIRCAITEGARQRSPRDPPSRFVLYFIDVPGRPEDVKIVFPNESPQRKSSP